MPDLLTIPPSPSLACIVMVLGREPGLVPAVRSLLDQADPVELVVVASGDAGAATTLRQAGFDVPVVERREALPAGAARNLGIQSTRAPFVAFLAADCLAAPGWLAGRLRRHRAGAAAVASALLPTAPRNPIAWVTHVLLFARRMPGAAAGERLLYGVSYARELFDRFGLFPEDSPRGEDTGFNQRLTGTIEIEWAPEVVTLHRHPRGVVGLLADQYRRGARSTASWNALSGRPSARRVAKNALSRVPLSLSCAWRAAASGERLWILAAAPFLPLGALAYAAGALAGGRKGPS